MTETELIARLVIAMLFGTLVGLERQWHHKNAGVKTNTLVALGATTFAIISTQGFSPPFNPAQVAAGIVTGIGFIGGGVIMRQGASIQGVNSAATIWVSASIGLCIGVGQLKFASLVTVTVLAIQFTHRRLALWIDSHSENVTTSVTYQLAVLATPAAREQVQTTWSSFADQPGVLVAKYSETKNDPLEYAFEASFHLSEKRAAGLTALGRNLVAVSGVIKAEWAQTTEEQDRH